MKWLVAGIITAVALTGCKSSQTPFNTLAPFGSARVPPPSTNAVNASGNYYNGAAPPQTATPVTPGSPPAPAASQPGGTTSGKMTSNTNTNGVWQPSGKTASAAGSTNTLAASPAVSDVQPVAYHAGTNATNSTSLPAPPSSSSLRLSGMPVNDATTSGATAEPARFVPAGAPIEIAQLPQAAPAPVSTPASGTVVASAQASDQPAPAAATSQSTLQWKSRP